MLKLLRIVRILRLVKLEQLMRLMEGMMGKQFLRVLYLMAGTALITHMMACLFYYTAYLDDLSVRSRYQACGRTIIDACLARATGKID